MDINKEAHKIIKKLYGSNATFREGQLEAILATMTNSRTLVVQKTGWGKSLVYFTCTKLLRKQDKGVTLVVSPLLVLMENQIQAGRKLKLKCDVLNSKVKDRREDIINNMVKDKLDLVLITPETLFSPDIQAVLKDIKIGMFVIDECHCISDWGHDFRLEYSKLYKIIENLPQNTPVLATTATANNRVIADLKSQLGSNVYVSRGSLTRHSLSIQVLEMKGRVDRYAWILKNINNLPGSGIIYCLTQKDCDYLAGYLKSNNIKAESYHSGNDESTSDEILNKFEKNQIKAIVATIKLGMGYDKGDIGFVIHFQKPSNIVTYYQQIGRAGRNIPLAYAIMLSGQEDDEINNYFIDTAFPSSEECKQIYNVIESENGISSNKIASKVNVRKMRIEKTIQFLQHENAIIKDKSKYFATAHKYKYNHEHYMERIEIKQLEMAQIADLTKTSRCLSKYIVNALDDYSAVECGKCSNCLGKSFLSADISIAEKEQALLYLNSLDMPILPRKKWQMTPLTSQTNIKFINQVGKCLSRYGDAGYGEMVKHDKYNASIFCEELVIKSAELLKSMINQQGITHITNVPSLRHNKVANFSQRLAKALGIEYIDLLQKLPTLPQKAMENSSYQCYNALKSFEVKQGVSVPISLLLVDDVIDSKWSITVCGYKLMEKGASLVYPFALAESSKNSD